MGTVTITEHNALFVKVDCSSYADNEFLASELSYEMPNLHMMKRVRPQMFKHWDGIFSMYKKQNGLLYKGLLERATYLLEQRGCLVDDRTVDDSAYSKKMIDKMIARMIFTLKDKEGNINKDIDLLDHQYNAVHKSLEKKVRRFELATSAGKTLFSYALLNIWLQTLEGKLVIVVPTLALMNQAYNDFQIFSLYDDNFTMDDVGLCFGETEKNLEKNITIACYKSLEKVSKEEMAQISAIIIDEGHRSKAKTFQKIFDRLVNCEYRIGMSGTFNGVHDKDAPNDLQIEAILGPIDRDVKKTARELIEDGVSQEVVGRVYFLKPSDQKYQDYIVPYKRLEGLKAKERKGLVKEKKERLAKLKLEGNSYMYNEIKEQPIITENKGYTYNDELEFLINSEERNTFICELMTKAVGNGLILVRRVNTHGVILDQMLKGVCEKLGYNYYYIHGKGKDKAAEVKRLVEQSDGRNIILSQIDMVAEGWSVNNLHFGIMATPMKDSRKFQQLIGRFMRKDNTNITPVLYCIADDLREKPTSEANYALTHACLNIETFYHKQISFKTKELKL